MRPPLCFVLLATTLAPALPIAASAQVAAPTIQTLQIGSTPIRIPTPKNFVETSRRAPDVWTMALAYSAGDARIVAHFVTQSDLTSFEKGNKVYFRQFLLVQTPRRAESIQVNQAQFDKLRAGTVAMQADISSKLEPRLAEEVDRVSKAVSNSAGSSIKVSVGEMVPVSIDRNDSRVLSYSILATAGMREDGLIAPTPAWA